MQARSLTPLLAVLLGGSLIAGCGLARQLTTRHKTFTTSISLPPMPANTMGHGQYTLDEEVEHTYQKYHGGVDWTKLAYEARNSSAAQGATVKLYVSLADNVPANQLDQQATLVDTITLAPSEDKTLTLDQAAKNDTLRAFLASVLSQQDVQTIHFYAQSASGDPVAVISVPSFTAQVEVHGSYF